MIATLPALTRPARELCGYPFLGGGLDWPAAHARAEAARAVLVTMEAGVGYVVPDAATYNTLGGACNFYLVPVQVAV